MKHCDVPSMQELTASAHGDYGGRSAGGTGVWQGRRNRTSPAAAVAAAAGSPSFFLLAILPDQENGDGLRDPSQGNSEP